MNISETVAIQAKMDALIRRVAELEAKVKQLEGRKTLGLPLKAA